MKEVLRTNDPVRLSYGVALLQDAGCHPFVADRFMSAAEGGISAFQRRVLVPDEEAETARRLLLALDEPAPPHAQDDLADAEGADLHDADPDDAHDKDTDGPT
jgi:hypothetical protein